MTDAHTQTAHDIYVRTSDALVLRMLRPISVANFINDELFHLMDSAEHEQAWVTDMLRSLCPTSRDAAEWSACGQGRAARFVDTHSRFTSDQLAELTEGEL